MWLFKLHCNERKVTFMANKTNSLSHTKLMCKYHIVFSPKYRRKIIYNQYRKSLQDIIRTLCRYEGVEIIEGHVMLDHVHLVLTMAYVYMTEGVGRGFVNVSKNKNTEGRYWCECEIMTDLAGAAADEKIFGETGFGYAVS